MEFNIYNIIGFTEQIRRKIEIKIWETT
jgi:hypothetical protein